MKLQNLIIDRLQRHMAGYADIQALENLNAYIARSTPSGQSDEDGLILAVDLRGGNSTMATTGDAPGRGKDKLQIPVVFSATLWHRERAQAGDTESRQAARDRVADAIRDASDVLLEFTTTITTDPKLPGDPDGYYGLWYNLTNGFSGLDGWIHYDAEGQFRQVQLGVTLHLQKTRLG